jgi:hypothetical protein
MDSGHASRTVSAVVTNHDCSWSIHLRGTSSTRTTSEHHDGGLLPWVKCSQRAGCPLGIDVTWNFSAGEDERAFGENLLSLSYSRAKVLITC